MDDNNHSTTTGQLEVYSPSASINRERRKGICAKESPVRVSRGHLDYFTAALTEFDKRSSLGDLPSYSATYSGSTSGQSSLSRSARRACEFLTFTGTGRLVSTCSASGSCFGSSFRSNRPFGGELHACIYPSEVQDQTIGCQTIRKTRLNNRLRGSLLVGIPHAKPPELIRQNKSFGNIEQLMPAPSQQTVECPNCVGNNSKALTGNNLDKSAKNERGATNDVGQNQEAKFYTISLTTEDGLVKSASEMPTDLAAKCQPTTNGKGPSTLDVNKLSPFSQVPSDKSGALSDSSSVHSARSLRSQRHQNEKPPFPMAGILSAIAASFFFATSMFFIKLIPDGTDISERAKQLFFRGIIMVIFTSITIVYTKSTFKVRRDEILINLMRSVFGYTAVLGSYIALKYISIGESQAIIFSAPIWTSIWAYFILGEKFNMSILMGLPVSVLGLILIAHPDLIVDVRKEVAQEIHYHHHESQYHLLHHHNLTHLNGTHQAVPFGANSTLAHFQAQLDQTSPNQESLNHLSASFGSENSNQNETYIARDFTGMLEEEDEDLELAESYFETRLPGIVISVITSIFVSIVYIVLKFRKSTPVQTTTFHLGVATIVLSFLVMCFVGRGRWPDTTLEWMLLLGNGTFSWVGQTLFQWSTSYENASVLSVLRSFDVVLGFVYSAMFLDEDVLWTSVVGSILILSVVAVMILHNYITSLCKSKSNEDK